MITVYDHNATLQEVGDVPLVTPSQAGPHWKGIPHYQLLNALLSEIEERGWTADKPRFSLTKNGAGLAGAFEIDVPKIGPPEGMRFALGILTDNAYERALRLYAGADVSVCNNGLATGQIILAKRHTKNFDLKGEIAMALDDYLVAIQKVGGIVDGLKNHKLLGGAVYEHLLIEAGRERLMPWSRLGKVDTEYRNPRFPDEIGTETSWALLNAFTWVVKRNPPYRQMDQINRFRQMLPTAAA